MDERKQKLAALATEFKEALDPISKTILGATASISDTSIEDLTQAKTELSALYKDYLAKKGRFQAILSHIKNLSPEEKRSFGSFAQSQRKELEQSYRVAANQLEDLLLEKRILSQNYDVLRPMNFFHGHLHPITQLQNQIEDIFSSMGFRIMEGPEVETDQNNFSLLNFSEDHPARDMQDTIWTTEKDYLLRTHTSPVQVRAMSSLTPPFRIIAPGRCFRNEETDASHEHTFHQVEGMLIDKEVSIAQLIYIMRQLLSSIFEREVQVRLRPGYFPFVEPGFELDMSCLLCSGAGCAACKYSTWVEILPCGLVHPNVLRQSGLDPHLWSGFAFGLGLDRLVMMRYSIQDIRYFLSGNLRFLEQF